MLFEQTEQEKEILNVTADLWNLIIKLPVLHPDDNKEISFHIHAIQNAIMARPVQEDLTKTH